KIATTMPFRFRLIVALLLAATVSSTATLEKLSVDQMIQKSTIVVRGTVSGSYAAFRGPLIYTHWKIQVQEELKGSAAGSIEVVTPGGRANALEQTFSGSPLLLKGSQYVLFVWRSPSGLHHLVGLSQGALAVKDDSKGAAVVTRMAISEPMLDVRSGKPVRDEGLTLSLDELRQRVRSAAGAEALQ
ncbi:MAG: hypothetical protein KJZ78_06530, partial [Bryobacteraceae bacterium]|nr:hypothetical protein [Bryobacteraceae bacterium]